jgi:exodeoxyribonuclease VII small subunit
MPTKTTTFEQALARLDEIVARLDGGEAPLEEALALFAEGAQLMTFCDKKLADAKLTVEKLFPEETK